MTTEPSWVKTSTDEESKRMRRRTLPSFRGTEAWW
ncbi:hypothetical protein AHiyo8_16280 [Arthrobacter sp. Hiyo8]|nr:hypothetical protein AHiyo8_16280 [Arthrobacter sp. Hiyo8]